MTKYAVGDAAYIDFSRYSTVTVVAGTVAKVTPSGQITVKHARGETRFTPHGREIGGDTWHSAKLIDRARYDELRAHNIAQAAERAARDALVELTRKRPTSDNKAEVLALLEAARIAVEAL